MIKIIKDSITCEEMESLKELFPDTKIIVENEGCHDVEFVEYTGAYPNLCSGNLIVKIDGEEIKMFQYDDFNMMSGGYMDDNWEPHCGPWLVAFTDSFVNRYGGKTCDKIEELIQKNVEQGCCGGCA